MAGQTPEMYQVADQRVYLFLVCELTNVAYEKYMFVKGSEGC